MTLGDVDVAVGRDQEVVRLEKILRIAAAAGLAEREEQLAVRTELEDLMAFGRVRHGRRWYRRWYRRGCRACTAAATASTAPKRACAVHDPDVVVAIHHDPVRRENQPSAERLHQ